MTAEPDQPPTAVAQDRVDADLVGRLQQGDEQAFTTLVQQWAAPMLRLAMTQTRMRALAEESVQDTWLAVLQGIAGFEGRSALKTWVFRILVYTARAKVERERRVPPLTDVVGRHDDGAAVPEERFLSPTHPRWPGHWSEPPRAWARIPDDAALDAELGDQIQAAVDALPERQRAVLTLRDIEGWSAQEVCEVLGLEAGNQRVLLHRARSAVRTRLDPYLTEEPA
jgi:RNA polymerase sigma-70 factor (ECF subfamily)